MIDSRNASLLSGQTIKKGATINELSMASKNSGD